MNGTEIMNIQILLRYTSKGTFWMESKCYKLLFSGISKTKNDTV
jgi:hypothetical protein